MHFYDAETGDARHFVPMSSRPDELRPTRITDVRKAAKEGNVWMPSVSTILNVLDKPALKNWLVDQHLNAAYFQAHELDSLTGTLDDFRKAVKSAAELEMAKAPDSGTDIHDQLEQWAKGNIDVERPDICEAVQELIHEKTGLDLMEFETEYRFVNREKGYAGMIDLFHPSGVIIDYKSKQLAEKFKPGKMAYPDHARQLAAYGDGVGCVTSNDLYINLFICLEDGELDWHHWSQPDIERGLETFEDSLRIWHREVFNPFDYMEDAA